MPNQLPSPPSRPLASATSATNASTIAPTATASLTPVCAPCAAAMMMLAGLLAFLEGLGDLDLGVLRVALSAARPAGGSSGMIILAIRIPPGADMKAAASR